MGGTEVVMLRVLLLVSRVANAVDVCCFAFAIAWDGVCCA